MVMTMVNIICIGLGLRMRQVGRRFGGEIDLVGQHTGEVVGALCMAETLRAVRKKAQLTRLQSLWLCDA